MGYWQGDLYLGDDGGDLSHYHDTSSESSSGGYWDEGYDPQQIAAKQFIDAANARDPSGWEAFFGPPGGGGSAGPDMAAKVAQQLGWTPQQYTEWMNPRLQQFGSITNPFVAQRIRLDTLLSGTGLINNPEVQNWRASVEGDLESGGQSYVKRDQGTMHGWEGIGNVAKAIGFVGGALGGFASLAGGAGLGASLGAAPSEMALGAQGLSGAAGGLGTGGSMLSSAPLTAGAGIGGTGAGLGFNLPAGVATGTEGAISGAAGGSGLGFAPSAYQAANFGYAANPLIMGPTDYSLAGGLNTGGQGFNMGAPTGQTGLYPQGASNLTNMGGGQGLTATPQGGGTPITGGGISSGQSFGDFLKKAQEVKKLADPFMQQGGGGQAGPTIQATTEQGGVVGEGSPLYPTQTPGGPTGPGWRQSQFYGPLTSFVDEALGYGDEYYSTGSGETIGTKDVPQQGPLIQPTVQAYADGGQLGMREVMPPAPSPQGQLSMMAPPPPTDPAQMMQMRIGEMARRNPEMVSSINQQAQQAGVTSSVAQQLWQICLAAMQNPQMYPQIRQYAVTGMQIKPSSLPEQFDMQRLSTLAGVAHIIAQGEVPTVPTAPTGYAGGGKIRGPGSGTSDSVSARNTSTGEQVKVSNGEYVVSADVVRALGTDYFDKLQQKYHKPTGGFVRR